MPLSIPLLIIALFLLIRYASRYFQSARKLDGVNNILQENLRGMRLVKVFVRGNFERGKFNKNNADYTEFAVKAFRIMALNMPVMMLIMNMTIVAVLWFGSDQTWAGN